MRIVNELHEDNIIKELSVRFKQYRIDSNITQTELAKKAGVSVRTISRFEKGEDIGLVTITKLFKALGLAKNMEMLVPEMSKRPSYYHRIGKAIAKTQKNVGIVESVGRVGSVGHTQVKNKADRTSKKVEPVKVRWKWGDEE